MASANIYRYNHDPAITYTLDQFISMQISDDLTYYNFSIIEVMDGVEHTSMNMIEEYIDVLHKECLPVEFSDIELKKYIYRPDILAHDLYGSVQLDFVIMMLNDMIDPKEFTSKFVMLPYSSALFRFLDNVYSKESKYININRQENDL